MLSCYRALSMTTTRAGSAQLLRQLVIRAFRVRYVARCWQLRAIPASTECDDQVHRLRHLINLNQRELLLVGQHRVLLDDDVDVWIDSRLVPLRLKLKRLLCGLQRRLQLRDLLRVDAHGRHAVLDLLKGDQRGLAITGEIRVVLRDVLVQGGTIEPAIEDGLRQLRPD